MNNNFFEINSVVVVGASEKAGKVGNDLVKNLETFTGKKYGVNPSGGELDGIVFYKKILDLPEVPDIAVLVIPAKFVLSSLEELAKLGVKRVIIISAGFKEVGDIEAENKIVELAQKHEMRILGPNCLGYIDTDKNLNLSFGGGKINSGNIALISQSGAMAVALTDMALSTSIGFSKIISMGNKSDIDENDLLLELENDDNTKVIVMYLESIVKGRKFYDICSRVTQKKPIVLVKSGRSERGGAAASSHTGALSGENEVLETAFREAGIIVTSSLEEFFMFGQALSKSLPCQYSDLAQKGYCTIIPQKLAIITNAGGPGVMATDWTEQYNINMADFSQEEKTILMEGLPSASSVANPIDIIGDARSDRYKQILANLAKLPERKSILILLTPQKSTDVEEIARVIVDFEQKNTDFFVMTAFMGGDGVKEGKKILQNNNILSFDFPQKALKVFSILNNKNTASIEKIDFSENNIKKDVIDGLRKKVSQENKLCGTILSGEVLDTFGVNYLKEELVTDIDQIPTIIDENNSDEYVLKIASKDIAHKTDVDGVVLGVKSLNQAKEEYEKMLINVKTKRPDAEISGVTFVKQVAGRETFKEIFIGLKRDPSFGDILVVGLGGIYVNIFEDVQMAIAPVSKKRIVELFKNLKSTPLLLGARGQKGINFDLLAEEVYKLQTLFSQLPEIKEIDVNPLFANDKEVIVVDAKLYV